MAQTPEEILNEPENQGSNVIKCKDTFKRVLGRILNELKRLRGVIKNY